MMKLLTVLVAVLVVHGDAEKVSPKTIPQLRPAMPYMVDNTRNQHGVAPDKGSLNAPVIDHNLNTDEIMRDTNARMIPKSYQGNISSHSSAKLEAATASTDYWMANIAHGVMPYQSGAYSFFRNVKDYGAVGDGVTDDTAAINSAVSAGARCGESCGSSSVSGALVYFPPGTYMLSTPVIQLYYTQFVGDPNSRPTLKGMKNFTGIALVDTDVYIPGGNGEEWYINQNQFYRQIRNIIFDLTVMNDTNNDNGQVYAPTGLHWQVAQATSLQNCDFIMPDPHDGPTNTVGIFMENGSGGFVSDLYFFGGNIAFRAGSQQFTARGLTFQNCGTAISHIWNWGFTWKNIDFNYCYVAIDCQLLGSGPELQGTGSITLLDSTLTNVPYAIPVNPAFIPSITLDNVQIQNVDFLVYVSGSTNYLQVPGNNLTIKSWAMGQRYSSIQDEGSYQIGFLDPAPSKPTALLDATGRFYTRSKAQYELIPNTSFVVVTAYGVSNDGLGDQTAAINNVLSANVGKPIFFPAGVYLVEGTVFVPVNSVLVGEGWSQIMATGDYFGNEADPQVVIRFGNPGDIGSMEISDFLFTVKGATAGAVLVEWNVHESIQGSVAMWDCHFRVGGAIGSNLQQADCPKLSGRINEQCRGASLLLHVTQYASGYFENVWAWTADHDIDKQSTGNDTSASQIDIYSARGVLIESKGPVWLYGTASEHNAFYQYQISDARNIYAGHMQTETPYYMPTTNSLGVFFPGNFSYDPTFANCDDDPTCTEAWALRVLHSSDVYIYGAGFYNFFNDYTQNCLTNESCQERIIETSYTQGLWLYDLYTKGATEVISAEGGIMPPVLVTDPNVQYGFTTEISAWLALATEGEDIGDDSGSVGGDDDGGSGVVYIDPGIWNETNPTVWCEDPCIIVLPPLQIPTASTITYPPINTTFLVFGGTDDSNPMTVTSTITPSPVTITEIDYWNINITSFGSSGTNAPLTVPVSSSIQPTPTVVSLPNGITSTLYPPPFPLVTSSATQNNPTVTVSKGRPGPTCKHDCGHHCDLFCGGPCRFNCPPCLFCNGIDPPPIPGLPGPPPGPGQPSSQSQSSSDCTTTTTSECMTFCATTTSTSTACSSTCSNIVACEPNPTNGGVVFAPMLPAAQEMWAPWDGNTNADFIVYSSMASLVNSIWPLPSSPISPPTPSQTSAAPAPTFTYALWSQFYTDQECVDAHCHPETYLYNFFAMTAKPGNVCNAKYQSEMQDGATGLYPGTAASTMKFNDGVCGGPGPYWCNQTSGTATWACANLNGGDVGSCWETSSTATLISEICGDYIYDLSLYCQGPWNCDS